jgi:hypothetical protein
MGTGRTFNKKPVSRPKKAPRERARRERTQRKRLTELGVSEAIITHMTVKDIRQALRKPAKVEAAA